MPLIPGYRHFSDLGNNAEVYTMTIQKEKKWMSAKLVLIRDRK